MTATPDIMTSAQSSDSLAEPVTLAEAEVGFVPTAEEILGLAELDASYNSTASENLCRATDSADIVGVFIGLKQAAIIDLRLFEAVDIHRITGKLGLKTKDHTNLPITVVSRDDEALDVIDSFLTGSDDISTEAHIRIGELLGYLPTATEYFIKRLPTVNTPYQLPWAELPEDDIRNKFAYMVLSPDNFQQELEDYVHPLADAVRLLAPNTYEQVINDGETPSSGTLRRWLGGISRRRSSES